MTKPTLDKVLRKPAVCEATGYGLTLVDDLTENDPDFPKPFKLSKKGRAIGWWESEIISYQQKRLAERDRELKSKQRPAKKAAAK